MEKYFSLSFNIIDKNLFLITGDLKMNFSFDLVPGLRTKYSAILLS
jgi:hypothetical protein